MKKIYFVFCLFFCSSLRAEGSWYKFYEHQTSEERRELASAPLLRLEIKRQERGDRSYFHIHLHSLSPEREAPHSLFEERDQDLRGRVSKVIPSIRTGVTEAISLTLDERSNFLEFNALSSNQSFDLVTNMRVRLLAPITSDRQIRIFSEHEVVNPNHVQGTPSIILEGRSLLRQILNAHLERYPDLLHSSRGRDIVVFLGKTGAGKSTLINYLKETPLRADRRHIILSDPSDPTTMRIGNGSHSETQLPQFTQIGGLAFYDLPGFGDTRGTAVGLMNASFIKNILEKARSVKLVFVAGYDEITAGRGALLRELLNTTHHLLRGRETQRLSALVITKSPAEDSEEQFKSELYRYIGEEVLNPWIEGERLARMISPRNGEISDRERSHILRVIERTPTERIENLNIAAIYGHSELDYLEAIYVEEIKAVLTQLVASRGFREEELVSVNLASLNNMRDFFQRPSFFSALQEQLVASPFITLLQPLAENIYHRALDSQQDAISIQLRTIQDAIEQESTRRRRNLLISPSVFAEGLNSISDISRLFEQPSQIPLAHRRTWAKQVLEIICTRNHTAIRRWLDGIVGRPYDQLSETDRTYTIPEIFGTNGNWEFIHAPILQHLIVSRQETPQDGHHFIEFKEYRPEQGPDESSEPRRRRVAPTLHGVPFKRTHHTEETARRLSLDPNYQGLFTRRTTLERVRDDADHRATEQRRIADETQSTETTRALNNRDRNIAQIPRDENSSERRREAERSYRRRTDQIDQNHTNRIRSIDRAEEIERARCDREIERINDQIEDYEQRIYPRTTITDSPEQQVLNIMELIRQHFNPDLFMVEGVIHFGTVAP